MTIGSSPTSFIKISASVCYSGANTITFLLLLCLSAHKGAGLVLRLTFLRFNFLSYPMQMGFPLRKLAMKLLYFQILALAVEAVFNLTSDEDQVAPALKLVHFDCSEMTECTLYAKKRGRTMPYYA